jgi:hypothetical protein
MSSGGQSNASQTPFAPNYGQAQGIKRGYAVKTVVFEKHF